MSEHIYQLTSEQARDSAKAMISYVPTGYVVTISGPKKTRAQEDRYHAMLNDIAKQCEHLNLKLDRDTWKRLAIDQFKRETLKEPECCAKYWARNQLNMIPALDGSGMVVLGEQSRKFPIKVATVFIEWLFAWGATNDVIWSDPTVVPLDVYAHDREAA